MDARQTEYKGVVYKSKSEAQLAHMFDLRMSKNTDTSHEVVIYEPNRLITKDKYVPDFMRVTTYSDFFVALHIEVIEYKPSEPNKTYLQYLEKQFSYIMDNDKNHFIDSFLLYYGTVYNKKIFAKIFNKNDKVFNNWSFNVDWMNSLYDECSKYRFDL